MLVHELIETSKEKRMGAYRAYLRSIVGALYSAFASPTSVSSSKEFKAAIEESRLRLMAEIVTLESDMRQIVTVAPFSGVADVPEINDFISSLAKDTIDLFTQQSLRDAAQVRHILVETRMGVSVDVDEANDYQRLEQVQRYVDQRMRTWARNGARWKSERFVRVAINHAMTRAYNESFLYMARLQGFGRFKAVYSDKRVTQPLLLTDYQSGELSRIFHPSSSALVDIDI